MNLFLKIIAFQSILCLSFLKAYNSDDLDLAINNGQIDQIKTIIKNNPELLSPEKKIPPLFSAFSYRSFIQNEAEEGNSEAVAIPIKSFFNSINTLMFLDSPLIYSETVRAPLKGKLHIPLLPYIFNTFANTWAEEDFATFINEFIDKKGLANQKAIWIEKENKEIMEISTIFFALHFCLTNPHLMDIFKKLIEIEPSFLAAKTMLFSSDLSLAKKSNRDLLSFCCMLLSPNIPPSVIINEVSSDFTWMQPKARKYDAEIIKRSTIKSMLLFLLTKKVDPFTLLEIFDENGKIIQDSYSSWLLDLEDISDLLTAPPERFDFEKILEELKKWPNAKGKLAKILNTKDSNNSYVFIKIGINHRFTSFLKYAAPFLDLNFLKESLEEVKANMDKTPHYLEVNANNHKEELETLIKIKKGAMLLPTTEIDQNLKALAASLEKLSQTPQSKN